MSNHISHAALPYPIKNARYTVQAPYLDADGDPTDPTTPDTEVSQDGGGFADAAEEVSTITGGNGLGYITLTGAEMNNSAVGVCFKVASGPKATLMTLNPRALPIVGSGTLSAGSAGGGTLGTLLAYDVTGCFIRTTGGTGGGGTGGANNQARRIMTYNASTGAFTVTPNWETTPSTDTTYDVLLPEGVTLGMLRTLNPTTAGRTLDVSSGGEAGIDWANVGSPTTTNALTGTTIATTQKVDLETIKTQSVTCAAGVTVPAALASTTNITAGTMTTTTNLTNAPTNGDLTATMKTSVTTAASAATPAVTVSDKTGFSLATPPLDAAGTRSAVGLSSANLDTQLSGINSKTINLPSDPADASDIAALFTALTSHGDSTWSTVAASAIRSALGMASANLDTQLGALPTSGEVADAVWDELVSGHASAGTYGRLLAALGKSFVISSVDDGSAAAGQFNGASGLSSDDDFYNRCLLVFTSGALVGISRVISDYVGADKTFKFNGSGNQADAPFPTDPADTDEFIIISRAGTAAA